MEDYESDDHEQEELDVESTNHESEEKIISPKIPKESQPNSPSMSTKPQHYDEEDNWSSGSSTSTSVRTNKSRVTFPVAPRFTCEERLERRKEYYAKLEEKNKALEKEKLEQESRTKEEEHAAIKQMRKSMVYKANPIPSFYREGPPPKVELKKMPVTRAKSPKLTRRKSCGDAGKTSPDDMGHNEQATHHSIGNYRDGKNSTPKGKNRITTRKSNENSQVKDQVKDHPEEEEEDADSDVES